MSYDGLKRKIQITPNYVIVIASWSFYCNLTKKKKMNEYLFQIGGDVGYMYNWENIL